jgi:hypothetical protein
VLNERLIEIAGPHPFHTATEVGDEEDRRTRRREVDERTENFEDD